MKIVQKKICLLGDFSVGKTSLIRRYVEERFDESYLSTIGVHMSRKRLERADHFLDFFIWDLIGGEDFTKIGQNYLLGAAGALIVCDLTRPDSVPKLAYYAEQMRAVNETAVLIFIGNKVDLTIDRAVTDHHLRLALATLADSFLLTSAKTGENVNEAFTQLADALEED
ncbi:Rab family GTPase [Candidatus Leptofilum sp.]|uniref:Rab family GTPase n=1 Tax=Candidatus Leptofilum sp. TaxID=3241576 RepID=UPI003B5A92F9